MSGREYVTPDARPPYTVRRMAAVSRAGFPAVGGGPTHIVARDGFTIIATVNHDRNSTAEALVAALNAAHSAGLSTEALEAGVVEKALEALRDAEAGLDLATLVSAKAGHGCHCEGEFVCTPHKALESVRAVLALAGNAEPRS